MRNLIRKFSTVCMILFATMLISCDSGKKTMSGTQGQRKFSYQRQSSIDIEDLDLLQKRAIGGEVGDRPWIAQVNPVDLNQDGRMDVLACESKHNTVFWLQQREDGEFDEMLIAENMRAPVRVETADMDKDGDIDIIVSSMSVIFPNNDKIGAIFILENDGEEAFTPAFDY